MPPMMMAAPPSAPPAYVLPQPRQAPAPPPMLSAPPAPARQVIARGAAPEAPPVRPAPPRRPLVMPSPDQLGVQVPVNLVQQPAQPARPVETALDWTAARRRMKELGVSGFVVDEPPSGGCHFTCWISNPATQQSRRIEALAASESEAVRLALDRVAQLAARR